MWTDAESSYGTGMGQCCWPFTQVCSRILCIQRVSFLETKNENNVCIYIYIYIQFLHFQNLKQTQDQNFWVASATLTLSSWLAHNLSFGQARQCAVSTALTADNKASHSFLLVIPPQEKDIPTLAVGYRPCHRLSFP